MARSFSVHKLQIPTFWTLLLAVVALGKAAVLGASLALAVLGAFDIAFAATASHWLDVLQKEYLNYVAIGGGFIGAVIRAFMRE